MIRTDSLASSWAANLQQSVDAHSTEASQISIQELAAVPDLDESNVLSGTDPYSLLEDVLRQPTLSPAKLSHAASNVNAYPASDPPVAQFSIDHKALSEQAMASHVDSSHALILRNGSTITVSNATDGTRFVTEQNGRLRTFSAQNSDQDLINSGILNGEPSVFNQLFDKHTMPMYGIEATLARSGAGDVVLVLPGGAQLRFQAQTSRVDLFKSQLVEAAVTAYLRSNARGNQVSDSTLVQVMAALSARHKHAEKTSQAQTSALPGSSQIIKASEAARTYALEHLHLKSEQILSINPVIARMTSDATSQENAPDFLPQEVTFLTKTPDEAEQELLAHLTREIGTVARQLGLKTLFDISTLLIGAKAAQLSYGRAALGMRKASLDEGFKRMYGELAASATKEATHLIVAGVTLKLAHSAATDTLRNQFKELTSKFNAVFRQAYGVDSVVID
jgi:hypothetical protein